MEHCATKANRFFRFGNIIVMLTDIWWCSGIAALSFMCIPSSRSLRVNHSNNQAYKISSGGFFSKREAFLINIIIRKSLKINNEVWVSLTSIIITLGCEVLADCFDFGTEFILEIVIDWELYSCLMVIVWLAKSIQAWSDSNPENPIIISNGGLPLTRKSNRTRIS